VADDRRAGDVIDARYELRHPLGQGGMGVVWRAHDSRLGVDVAVKEVRFPAIMPTEAREAFCQRLGDECRQVATLDHPAVVRVLDVVYDDGPPLVVTELVEAPTLAVQVESGGPLPPEQAAAVGIDMLDALAAAHEHGLVHRFVQPAKVVLPAGGGARLADFGLVALIGDPLVSDTGAIGSVSYMAPEQQGRPIGDRPADVWSVAATLFYAVEGRPPYDAASAKRTLAAIADDQPRPLLRAGVLRPILESALVKDPAARPQVGALRAMLAGVADASADVVGVGAVGAGTTAGGAPWYAGQTLADPGESPFFGGQPGAAEAEPQVAPQVEAEPEPEVADDGVWLVGVPFGPAIEPAEGATNGTGEGDGGEPPPLPSKVALSRMFSPDVEQPPPPYEDAVPPDDPPPRAIWPLDRPWRPGAAFLAGMTIALLVFLLVTGTRYLTGRGDSVARSGAAAVNWVSYTDPGTGFRIEHPSNWTVTPSENTVDFRDPGSSAALRIAIQSPPRASPEEVWLELERRFRTEHPSYERLRLEPTTVEGREAAAWEFTWTDTSGTRLRNSDVAMNVGNRAFALNFQTRADEWERLAFLFDRFRSSFEPPP
jgi:eukaryotic-like serine/threonine-protein kinase